MERQAHEPGALGQVGRRFALDDPPFQQAKRRLFFGWRQARLKIFGVQIRWQMQGMQYQRRRFVDGVVGAVAEMEAGLVHAAGAPADQVTDRVQMG